MFGLCRRVLLQLFRSSDRVSYTLRGGYVRYSHRSYRRLRMPNLCSRHLLELPGSFYRVSYTLRGRFIRDGDGRYFIRRRRVPDVSSGLVLQRFRPSRSLVHRPLSSGHFCNRHRRDRRLRRRMCDVCRGHLLERAGSSNHVLQQPVLCGLLLECGGRSH